MPPASATTSRATAGRSASASARSARETVDLKAWTAEQLIEEAHAAFERVWQQRDGWGNEDASESTIDIAEFLSENNYPERIRGTLRDRLTYLWADLLANSSFWSPTQSNEKFKLDAALLIHADDALRGVDLTDPTVHPLTRLAAILGDLERWHNRQDRPEAAFEARLDRLRRLIQAFGAGSSKTSELRDGLRLSVESFSRDLPWWSMGMARLAEQVRTDEREATPLVAARAIALGGAEAHPESLGAQTCRAIVEQIEAPSVSVASMSNDGTRRRSIELSYKNLTRLYFRAYRTDLIDRVESSNDYQLL